MSEMTEAQRQLRRALQESLDRRDNGGAPRAVSGSFAVRPTSTWNGSADLSGLPSPRTPEAGLESLGSLELDTLDTLDGIDGIDGIDGEVSGAVVAHTPSRPHRKTRVSGYGQRR